MCVKVKRRCRAMLRLMRSLRYSSGELRGESQGDIPGDPLGELDGVCGRSLMGWELLSGKETASPELSHRASLILKCDGSTNLPSYAEASWQVVPFGHLREENKNKWLASLPFNSACHIMRHLWSVSALLLGKSSSPISIKLCVVPVDGHKHECRSEPSPQR